MSDQEKLEFIHKLVEQSIQEEREACAIVADAFVDQKSEKGKQTAANIAFAIRARTSKTNRKERE